MSIQVFTIILLVLGCSQLSHAGILEPSCIPGFFKVRINECPGKDLAGTFTTTTWPVVDTQDITGLKLGTQLSRSIVTWS